MAVHKKYPALGRGLDALIDRDEEIHTSGSLSTPTLTNLDTSLIRRHYLSLLKALSKLESYNPSRYAKWRMGAIRLSQANAAGGLQNWLALKLFLHIFGRLTMKI